MLSYEDRHEAMKRFCEMLTTAWTQWECLGHPMEVGQDFIDVLFLANRNAVLPKIQQLLSEKNVSFRILPVNQFQQISNNLQLIGTIVIDAQGMTLDEQESLDKIIAILDTNHIATILLNNWLNFSQKKCSLLTTLHSSTIEELWGNISANLAYRKRTSAIHQNPDSKTENKEKSTHSTQILLTYNI